jgi:hypothetical protein
MNINARPATSIDEGSSGRRANPYQGCAKGKWLSCRVVFWLALGWLGLSANAPGDCLNCHAGIEAIADGRMADQIQKLGKRYGDPSGCVVCHGGDSLADDEKTSHQGSPSALADSGGPRDFYSNPGATPVSDRTCGQCHEGYAGRWRKSVMSTEAESIERHLCGPAWKIRMHRSNGTFSFGRYDVEDDDGSEPVAGTPAYKEYMKSLVRRFPELFPTRLHAVPIAGPPKGVDEDGKACHVCHGEPNGVDRGTGCSACHIPYRQGGTYRGIDSTIPRKLPGRLLVHRIQGTGNTRVSLPDKPEDSWRGIPLDNCFGCHFDPRNLGVSELGAVHAHYTSAPLQQSGGLLCQDCHTSVEMHGDGNLAATSSAQREVYCEDCHGTTDRFPWELPLGYKGPEAMDTLQGTVRGLGAETLDIPGKRYAAKDGYLLTSRGNPFGNVVKDGGLVMLHSASGKVFEVTLLKQRAQQNAWQSELGRQVKSVSKGHAGMACTDCHADWAPPCYGCHVDVDLEHGAEGE